MPPYVLVLPGPAVSPPGHWQGWLAGALAHRGAVVDVPRLSDPDRPVLDVWLTELREHLALAARDEERIVLAHASACAPWLHHAARLTDAHEDHLLRFDRVLLVAPSGPVPTSAAGIRRAAALTRMVVGADDPHCSLDEARALAQGLEVDLDVIPGGAHLDASSGYGPWPSVLEWAMTGRTPVTARP